MNLYFKLGALLLVAFVTWYATSDHYQKRIAEIQLETATAVQTELFLAAAREKTAGEQHAKDQLYINALSFELSNRVRVHIPVCSGGSQASEDSDREARLLSERVDAAFERIRAGATNFFTRCEQLNLDAIESNESQ